MIDPQPMFASLDGIVAHLRRLGRRVPDLLQPGLDEEQIKAREADVPFAFTRELQALYRWRNGTRALAGDILDELNFFPGFYFMSIEEAIRTFRERESAPQWRPGWFPVFADGAGDFYIVPCKKKTIDRSEVIGFLHGEPAQVPEYESLTAMAQTQEAAFAAGAFYLDQHNRLEIDDAQYRVIAHTFNPGIPEWQS
jgi:cell wall assembly regulator SMI1